MKLETLNMVGSLRAISPRGLMAGLFLCLTLTVMSQTTMRDVFKQMPDSIVPYLTENNRLDFIDFIDSNMKAEVTNAFGGKSEMQKLTDDYLSLHLNAAASIEMRLLDVKEPVDSASRIVCLVSTLGSDVRESKVAFFSLKWKPLPTERYVQLPAEMFVAKLSDQEPTLTVTRVYKLDVPANEEQKMLPETSTILKWAGVFVNNN